MPETFDGHWNDGRRIVFFGVPSMVDDVGFLQRVMADLVAEGTVRADAVYLAGFSNGGLMALTLACRPAPVRPAGLVTAAATLRAAPLFPFSGGMGMVNGRTGELMLSADATTDLFAESNGCGLRGPASGDATVRIAGYRHCPPSGDVFSVALIDGGHLWPDDPKQAFGSAAGGSGPVTLAELAGAVFRVNPTRVDQLPGAAARISTSPPVALASTP